MEQLIDAVLTWLKGAGFQAVRRMPEGEFPELSGAVVAVDLEKAEATDAGLYSYLGVTEMDGKTVSIYGRRLEAQVAMEVVSPPAEFRGWRLRRQLWRAAGSRRIWTATAAR